MSLKAQSKQNPLEAPRVVEEVDQVVEQDARPEQSDEAVTRALEMYLRQRALVSPTDLPRWITW